MGRERARSRIKLDPGTQESLDLLFLLRHAVDREVTEEDTIVIGADVSYNAAFDMRYLGESGPISLDTPIHREEHEDQSLSDFLVSKSANGENEVTARLALEKIINDSGLTDMQKAALELHFNGFAQTEIADIMNLPSRNNAYGLIKRGFAKIRASQGAKEITAEVNPQKAA